MAFVFAGGMAGEFDGGITTNDFVPEAMPALGGIGASMTLTDPTSSVDVTLTTVDVVGDDGSRASDGDGVVTNAHVNNGLGIATPGDPGGYGTNEYRNFNPNEFWEVTFNTDVKLIEIDLESQDTDALLEIIIGGTFQTYPWGESNDIHDLGGRIVPAGTLVEIGFRESNATNPNDVSFRIESLTVEPFIFLPGDYDGNQTVELADYEIWRADYEASRKTRSESIAADGNLDGFVNAADYAVWRNNLGATTLPLSLEGSAATAAPEACSLTLALTSALAACWRFRRTPPAR